MSEKPSFRVTKMTPYGPNIERILDNEIPKEDIEASKKPSFRVTEVTPYGPNIERIPDNEMVEEAVETSDDVMDRGEEGEVVGDLSESQRYDLRRVLLALGITLASIKAVNQPHDLEPQYHSGPVVSKIVESKRKGDAFSAEVERYIEKINDTDLSETLQFAQKSVVGAPQYTRMEYLQSAIEFIPWDEEKKTGVPPVVAEELRRLLPGLGGQESRFNAALVSRSGARGIMQFMPKTWEAYGGKPEEATSLMQQVEKAGLFISDLYRQVRTHVGEETLTLLQSRFSTEEDFLREAMVPFVLNAYNTGAKRMAEVIKAYVEHTPIEEMPTGHALHLAIADFGMQQDGDKYLAGYGTEARDYVPKVYAMKERLSQWEKGVGQL